MKTVILTAGPQGAGKSTYCQWVLRACPEIELLSRDELLVELYGSAYLDPYTSGHFHAMRKLWERVGTTLNQAADHFTLILDCWNGCPRERDSIVAELRATGAHRVVAWYFVTPLACCIAWYVRRECNGDAPEYAYRSHADRCRYNFHHFHELAADLQCGSGFDRVIRINPLQRQLFPDIFI